MKRWVFPSFPFPFRTTQCVRLLPREPAPAVTSPKLNQVSAALQEALGEQGRTEDATAATLEASRDAQVELIAAESNLLTLNDLQYLAVQLEFLRSKAASATRALAFHREQAREALVFVAEAEAENELLQASVNQEVTTTLALEHALAATQRELGELQGQVKASRAQLALDKQWLAEARQEEKLRQRRVLEEMALAHKAQAETAAAVLIQAALRGHATRVRLRKQKEARKRVEEETQRNEAERHRLLLLAEAAEREAAREAVTAAERAQKAAEAQAKTLRENAATKLQALQRGRNARKKFKQLQAEEAARLEAQRVEAEVVESAFRQRTQLARQAAETEAARLCQEAEAKSTRKREERQERESVQRQEAERAREVERQRVAAVEAERTERTRLARLEQQRLQEDAAVRAEEEAHAVVEQRESARLARLMALQAKAETDEQARAAKEAEIKAREAELERQWCVCARACFCHE